MNTILYNTSFFGARELTDDFILFLHRQYVPAMREAGIADITVARVRDMDEPGCDDGFRLSVQCRIPADELSRWTDEGQPRMIEQIGQNWNGGIMVFSTVMDIIG